MNKYITTIFLCLIFFYNSTAQITSDPICPEGYKYSDDDVIISTIQYFDTLYCIHNINVSHEYIRSHIFANKAEFFFWSDSLDLPPMDISKEEFAQYMLKPNSFYKETVGTFIHRVILPAIHDSVLYIRVENSFADTFRPHSTIVKKEDNYDAFTYNTNCFLTVYIRARRFNYEINRIYDPPRYLFPNEAENSDCYIRFLIPLIPNSE